MPFGRTVKRSCYQRTKTVCGILGPFTSYNRFVKRKITSDPLFPLVLVGHCIDGLGDVIE